jgi:hypothetical protein
MGEFVVNRLHDRQHYIEADQVGQCQRTDRVIAAKLHALVDLCCAGISFGPARKSLIDHRRLPARQSAKQATRYGQDIPTAIKKVINKSETAISITARFAASRATN